MNMPAFLEQTFLHNTVLRWLQAIAVVLIVMLLFPVLRARLFRLRSHWKGRHTNAVIEVLHVLIGSTKPIVKILVALYLGQKLLVLPAKVNEGFTVVLIFGAWYQVACWASALLRHFVERRQRRDIDGDGKADPSPAVEVVMFIGYALIWALVTLLALANLGINITALVAGLGVGGIAIALAVQTILGDLLSSMSIAFDKPFGIGDRLRIDSIEGTVEHIGVRSTRLRSVTGEQVIVANGDILKSRIHNLGRMPERRIQARLYIQYESSPEQVKLVSQLTQEAVCAQDHTRFVSCLLAQLGTYALEFELTYFIANAPDMETSSIVDAVNREIFGRFSRAGINMAYPAARRIST
jgi:small-conductance mechanosensitive channel